MISRFTYDITGFDINDNQWYIDGIPIEEFTAEEIDEIHKQQYRQAIMKEGIFKFELGDFVIHKGLDEEKVEGRSGIIIARYFEETKGGVSEKYRVSIPSNGLNVFIQISREEELKKV